MISNNLNDMVVSLIDDLLIVFDSQTNSNNFNKFVVQSTNNQLNYYNNAYDFYSDNNYDLFIPIKLNKNINVNINTNTNIQLDNLTNHMYNFVTGIKLNLNSNSNDFKKKYLKYKLKYLKLKNNLESQICMSSM